MEDKQETCPKGDSDFVSDKVNFKTEEEDDDQIPCHSLEQVDFKSESEDMRQTDSGDEQAEIRAASCACQPSGKNLPAESEDDYGSLFSQYSSTLYNVAMEAVTQSLLSSRHISSRKKSPAWKHFFISPRDSTKAICTYCMKEFSRGKNEKDKLPHETCEAGTPHQAHSRKWKSISRVLLFPSLSVASTTACRCGRP